MRSHLSHVCILNPKGFLHSSKLAGAAKLQHHIDTHWKRHQVSTIARLKEELSPTRFYESINRPATSNKSHVVVAYRMEE
jgi:hypothetical protein